MNKISQWFLIVYAGLITAAFMLLFYAYNAVRSSDEITAKRINIVDEQGVNRLVISNEERMEPPIINGKKYERAVHPAGIIFYNEKGDECGGIALSRNPVTHTYALALDYDNADAIGLITQQNRENNSFRSGLLVNDKDHSGRVGSNISRISLMSENGNSSLVINGPDEKPRIIISVDSLGKPHFQMIDNKGDIIRDFAVAE